MQTVGNVSLNVDGARHSGLFELCNGVLTVRSGGQAVSVRVPDDWVPTDSAARILLRSLVERRSCGSERP